MNRKEVANTLKLASAQMFFRYRYSLSYELAVLPWGKRRADVIGCKLNGDLVVIEVKSCVADFRTDSKWTEYFPFCDRFYLAFTEKTAKKISSNSELLGRIPKRVGILVLDEKSGYMRTIKPAKRVLVEPETRLKILARMAWRSGDLSKRIQRARKRFFIE